MKDKKFSVGIEFRIAMMIPIIRIMQVQIQDDSNFYFEVGMINLVGFVIIGFLLMKITKTKYSNELELRRGIIGISICLLYTIIYIIFKDNMNLALDLILCDCAMISTIPISYITSRNRKSMALN